MRQAKIIIHEEIDEVIYDQIQEIRKERLVVAQKMLDHLAATTSKIEKSYLNDDISVFDVKNHLNSKIEILKARIDVEDTLYDDEVELYLDLTARM